MNVFFRKTKAQSAIEVLLSGILFVMLSGGVISALLYSRNATMLATGRSQAVIFAEEGMTALRSMRERDFGLLTNGTDKALVYNDGKWGFVDNINDDSDSKDGMTRRIDVAEGPIVGETKLVTIKVTYFLGPNRSTTYEIKSVLADLYDNTGAEGASSGPLQYGGNYASSGNFRLADQDFGDYTGEANLVFPPPSITVASQNPLDDATGVSIVNDMSITFSNPASIGTGNIEIRRTSDDALHHSIAVTDGARISGGGTNTITINMLDYSYGTGYYVLIPDTAFAGFAGISDKTTWNFTTSPIPITVATLNPLDGASGVSVSSNLVMTFSGNAVVGSGNITIQKTSDDSVVKTIAVGDGQVTGGGTTTITINPTTDLPAGTGLYVLVPATAFEGFAGISAKTTWNFTTTITVASQNPLDDATGVSIVNDMSITFSNPASIGTGNIEIRRTSDDALHHSIAVTDGARISGGGTNTITINMLDYSYGTGYYVLIPDTAFAGFAGISDKTTWNFTTSPIPITVATLNPLDGASGVSVSSNLVMTFSGNAVVGSGNITIQKTSDDSVVKTIAVGDGQVTGGGTTTITINPTTDLPAGTGLYVLVPATAFEGYAGISDKNTWNFTTLSESCIQLAGYASNPTYDLQAATVGPTLAVTPPTGMVAGDVVMMFAHYRGTVTLDVLETGGQTWTSLTQTQYSTTSTSRIFYATYNGTWSANPSVTVTTGVESMVVGMYVFRGVDGSNPLDVAQSTAGYSATTNVTRSGITTNTGGAMVLAFWSSVDDNSWDLMTRSQTDGVNGWRGLTTVSNTGGTDNSISVAYKITPTAGASGDVTNRQTRNGSDAGTTHILALRPAVANACPLTSGINLAGYASNPIYDQENGSTGRIGPTLAVTPPTGMVSGDVVVMFAHYRGTVTLAMSETGGQAWSALTQTQYSTTSTSRIFYATYNGTWSANPSVTVTTGVESMVVGMYVFRGVDGSNPLDVAQSTAGYAATTNVTRSGITTNTGGAMVLAFWSSVDDNSWDLMTRSQTDGVNGWRGLTTVSNQGGTDNSISVAYKITPTAGASGDVTDRQTRNGGDAGTTHIIALKPL